MEPTEPDVREVLALEPCPFCGGATELRQNNPPDGLIQFVCAQPSPCLGSGLFMCCKTEDVVTAVAAYNRRATRETAKAEARREALEEAAKVVEGQSCHEHYRTWAHWPVNESGRKGNQSNDSLLVKHCDDLAAAIRVLAKEG